ncbi:hypothetical protein K466DRAFT_271470 [Polyporus arcularius HHB13444]|uniref:Uncharacterized protein n=1 Tax=Polyporus arcularius HHB13444 TaxID=1314778 RepID=A0A5C3P2E4_9APHY|nr:hypothetical protein K466DRAFT_271470 [Polyporus arcularius HHB13444]
MRPRSSLLPAILHPRDISLVPCLAALPSVHPFYDTYVVSSAGRANVRRVSRLLQHHHRRRRCRLRLNRRELRCKQTMSQSYLCLRHLFVRSARILGSSLQVHSGKHWMLSSHIRASPTQLPGRRCRLPLQKAVTGAGSFCLRGRKACTKRDSR